MKLQPILERMGSVSRLFREVRGQSDGAPQVEIPAGEMSHALVLDENPHARFRSRILLAVGGVVYALWHFVHLLMQPKAIDPLGERLVFLAFVLGLIAFSFQRRFQRHLVYMGYVAVAVGTAHYFSLVERNNISSSYLVGVFVVLGAVSALLVSPRASVAFSVFTVVLAALVAGLANGAPVEERIELVVGVTTVQIGMAAAAWRNVYLQDAAGKLAFAQRQLRQLRGLLPICMHCNRIREGAEWQKFESYVESHTDATFTHSLCVDCAHKHYPGAA